MIAASDLPTLDVIHDEKGYETVAAAIRLIDSFRHDSNLTQADRKWLASQRSRLMKLVKAFNVSEQAAGRSRGISSRADLLNSVSLTNARL